MSHADQSLPEILYETCAGDLVDNTDYVAHDIRKTTLKTQHSNINDLLVAVCLNVAPSTSMISLPKFREFVLICGSVLCMSLTQEILLCHFRSCKHILFTPRWRLKSYN